MKRRIRKIVEFLLLVGAIGLVGLSFDAHLPPFLRMIAAVWAVLIAVVLLHEVVVALRKEKTEDNSKGN